MRRIAFLAFLALFITPCIAESDSITTGPYNVTFDLGIPKEDYKVVVAAPKTSESLSGDISTTFNIELINRTGITRRSLITLTSYETEQVKPTQDELMQTGKYVLSQDGSFYDIQAAGRKIDGYDGAVISGTMRTSSFINDIDTYSAIYHPSSTTVVGIFSLYPWDEGTLSLLKTIHVEKINATT